MAAELSAQEVERRVAILRRFRELMTNQRDKFRDYLTVLDKQKDVIEKGDVDALSVHVEIEEGLVAEILSIQKVVDPLEELYRTIHADKDGEVPQLKKALEELKNEAVSRAKRNRDLLSHRMDEVRSEIRTLRGNPFTGRRSVYADAGQASLVDIKG